MLQLSRNPAVGRRVSVVAESENRVLHFISGPQTQAPHVAAVQLQSVAGYLSSKKVLKKMAKAQRRRKTTRVIQPRLVSQACLFTFLSTGIPRNRPEKRPFTETVTRR